MPLVESVLRVQHPCPFNRLSVAFPEDRMALWCNRSSEVLEVAVADPRRRSEVVRRARKILKGSRVVLSERSAITITRRCGCNGYRSVALLADRAGAWLVPPVRYFDGWETHRVLSAGNGPVRRLVREIERSGAVEVVSCRVRSHLDDREGLASLSPGLFEDLTDRQLHVLASAFERGLLDVPARIRMGAAASAENVSRSTYGEHLRKAVRGIVRNCYPLLKLSVSPERR